MTERKLLKCGCQSMALCSQWRGVKYDPPIPACVIHDCIELAEEVPDLTGRMARCHLYGKGGFSHRGPIHGGGKCSALKCECEVPSSYDLPFFSIQPDKPFDDFFCGCMGWD